MRYYLIVMNEDVSTRVYEFSTRKDRRQAFEIGNASESGDVYLGLDIDEYGAVAIAREEESV